MKDANGFFHISPCMEGRGIERQAKKPKAITANRKINHSTTIFRFAVKIRDGKGKRRALRHLHFPPSFKTNLKLIAKSVPDHIERGIPKGLMHYTFYIPKPGMTAFRPV